MKTYIVQLDTHDDVISARDKISWSKASRVLLVWPRRGRVLERQVDLLLLQRHAAQLGAQMAIVTADGEARSNARGLGIPVFRRAEDAQKALWRRDRRRRRFPRRKGAPRAPITLREERAAIRAAPQLPAAARIAAFTAGVMALVALAVLFLPGARIELAAERKVQRLVIPIWASADLSAPNPSGGVPAEALRVVVEGREEGPVTGSARVAEEPASGEVRLTNLTDQPVLVPEGSIVMTLSAPVVRFSTTRTARLPAGPNVQVSVPVQAVLPGSSGNVAAGRIRAMEGALGLNLLVENAAPIGGGLDRMRPAASEQDYRALREKLLSALEDRARHELRSAVSGDQRLLDETVAVETVVEETRQPDDGQPGDRLMLSMRVAFHALTVREADLRLVAQSALNANREAGYLPVADSQNVAFDGPVRMDPQAQKGDTRTARGTLAVEQVLRRSLSTGDLILRMRGQTVQAARQTLEGQAALQQPPRIEIWPRWWPRLPFLPFRIEVVEL